jgi:predicted nucleotide-binding protein
MNIEILKQIDESTEHIFATLSEGTAYAEIHGLAQYMAGAGVDEIANFLFSACNQIDERNWRVHKTDIIARLRGFRMRTEWQQLPNKAETEISDLRTPLVKSSNKKIFIVHGHDNAVRESVARFVEQLGLQPIILHEQVNQNLTVIEKLEKHSDVGFAIVLLTPDDVGSKKGGTTVPRARQNVLIELGYFVGKLGRGRVCTLRAENTEIPSDFSGVVYTDMDKAGAWKNSLASELRSAGCNIDANALIKEPR